MMVEDRAPTSPATRHDSALAVIAAAIVVGSLPLTWQTTSSFGSVSVERGWEGPYAPLAILTAVLAGLVAAEIVVRTASGVGLPATAAGYGRGQVQFVASLGVLGLLLARYVLRGDGAGLGLFVAIGAAIVLVYVTYHLREAGPIRRSVFSERGDRIAVVAGLGLALTAPLPWYRELLPWGAGIVTVNAVRAPLAVLSAVACLLGFVVALEWAVDKATAGTAVWRTDTGRFARARIAALGAATGLVGIQAAIVDADLTLGAYTALGLGLAATVGAVANVTAPAPIDPAEGGAHAAGED